MKVKSDSGAFEICSLGDVSGATVRVHHPISEGRRIVTLEYPNGEYVDVPAFLKSAGLAQIKRPPKGP